MGVIFVPMGVEVVELKPLYHQDKVINVTLVKPPVKKKVKKVVKKVKKKPKPKPKPIVKPKPIPKPKPVVKKVIIPKPEPIKKIEKVVVKKEIIVQKKEEVKSEDDEARKVELAKSMKAKRTYYDTIFEVIAQNKRYPKKARRYKQEGSIKVSFKVLSDGTITDLKLLTLAKYKSLNKAVKKLFKRLEKFPVPPDNLSFPLELSITINYKLKR